MRLITGFSTFPALRRGFAIVSAAAVLLASMPVARADDMAESLAYQVKIGFLYNFARFAEWPPASLPDGAPFRLAIASDEATFAFISAALSGKMVNDRPLSVERLDPAGNAPLPHIVFFAQSATPEMLARAAAMAQSPVLTIGEHDGFARQHGILNFVLVDEAVRFEVNLTAAQRAGLRISSRVSKMAILVRPQT